MKRAIAATASLLTIAAIGVAAPPASAEDMTTITMKVSGCEGCTISSWLPVVTADGGPSDKAKVRNGVATLRIPTANTRGTSFQIDPVTNPYMDAVTLIVFQYKGAQPGEVISKAQAMTFRRGSACWAGTSEATAQFRVRVRSVWGPAFDPLAADPPARARQPLAWVVPTQQSAAPYWPLFKGALQAQDNPVCRF
ncbi:MAG: hypothetical protein ACRCU1_14470 [Alsobacter sp.]